MEEDAVFCLNCGTKAAGIADDDKTTVIPEEPSAADAASDLTESAEAKAASVETIAAEEVSEPAETVEPAKAETL